MIAGVSEIEAGIIKSILAPYQKEYEFYFYGSRVKGNFGKVSDLDVLIKGSSEVSPIIIEELKQKFDKSRLPYIVHFSDYHKMDTSFYESIKKDLTLLS